MNCITNRFYLQISFDPIEVESYTEISSKKIHKPMMKTKRKKKVYRPGVFIEAGVHGREWITPAVATWIIREIIKHNDTAGIFVNLFFFFGICWYLTLAIRENRWRSGKGDSSFS